MARTALTASSLTQDAGTALGAGATPDATTGNSVAAPGPYHGRVLIKNGDSASHTCIVRGAGYGGAAGGSANSSIAAAGYPFAGASQGDLSVAVAAGATTVIGPLTTDRYTQADGSLWLDWSASTSMTVWVMTDPYPAV